MADTMPITKSLHRLCVENPRFLVQPLFWTPKHLQVLRCHFQHLDSTVLPPSLPPSPPLSPSSDTKPDDTEHYIKQLLNGRFASAKFACFALLIQPHGVIDGNARPHFFYNRLGVHTPECETFKIGDAYNLQQRPIVGHFLYEKLVEQRRRALKPKRHPVEGASNVPGERIYQRRLRDLTPALWFEDPYLVCVLLSLAQLQWCCRKTTPEAFFVRLLVTNASDQMNAHVFRADIPSKLLHALDNPLDDMDGLVWPAIQHVQVPFEPHGSFSERVAGQLLAGLKTRALEESPRGEKRKRDEMDVAGEGKSVKSWDATVQPAAVPG
ncbi:hypothetical protein FOQG_19167 [Fusarium oxysporum f. sp. raphani 54005]|uniref:Uncharacterized protein n=4 Tax=Fusarium oxysporum TaxID=5507 RepID=A0A0J9VXT9_FUSO4|nr:hypothetical protein FOXG_12466 [Fusarium oxysporum f. sp. lycopersici 4287]XP_018253626.1 hypothetical protein FOXG_14072 [Fusarium oxysporum f. sp. lycopersici 4287]EXK76073.1 hypothetical protein FOQG_19167 [Fusarium oxysporum f. sp. raphani 54005]KAJ9413761.1 hypothetical protein QL093DRAFT_2493336 [Fusarium oxysporum]KNB13762.1 hypothetical protein FOXG_12466 [Fusarium oxysporum f. sp. lycopersici 4287]KNB15581.1 hypothetical protein FOXG_14072 [Fusarium oxysporum f. sp. lycopersici 42